ncbi:S-layer homology domain-containing protein [Flavonifractor plautii]|nr:S-layer homology domain-containing protein [Flavonifractor plautii]
MWFGSDGNLYAPGESISADVTKLTAQFNLPEQFTLAPGGTYYFDLSGAGIPGTANGSLPDASLHYVPFTYAGTVDAYKLTSEMATTEEYAQREKYPHSLFVADYVVTHTVSRDDLNTKSLIFGKDYVVSGVDYTLRAPSCGSGFTGSGDSECGTPQSNEWDAVLDKNSGYIQNWNKMYSWGQDTSSNELWYRAVRGYSSARYWNFYDAAFSGPRVGFRPVLEILNADTLGPDGLKVVTLDLGGGKLGGSSDAIHIIVKTGSTFTAPASDGLTRPDGNTGSYFMWLGSNGKLYAPGDNVPADVTKLTAQFALSEQFFLTPGGRYYFDLSAMNIPGTANGSLPDASLHYVPFTYVGTIEAYKLTSATATTEEYAQQNKYPHSLFVADYAVTHTISWGGLNDEGLIFGKDYVVSGVDYTLRAPSCGSGFTGSGDSECGTPQSNEWDAVLDKNSGYIQNWNKMYSWGQDTSSNELWYRAVRGYSSARYWNFYDAAFSGPRVGFRPVLEILNADTLGPDGLKVVTLDLGGGKLGGSSDAIHIIVKTGSTFTAPASDGLTRPDGDAGSFFMWLGSDGKLYDPGDNVPADVTKLTAQFASSSHSVTITTATLPDGKVGEAYSQTLIATGTTPITWSIIGALPDGLSLNKDTGKISGTPTAAGSSTFTVKATNSAGSDTKELSITITKDAPPAHEHSYGDWRKDGTSHWHECTDDDCPNREESINDKAAHVYDDDADTTCDVCGYERTVTPPSHEHSYGDWRKDGTNHWHECTDADCPNREESIKDKAAHVYTDDADTTCDVCGYERTVTPPSHEHSYGDWRKDGTNHWHECTDDDCPDREESIKDKAAHVYTDDADTTCDTCGYERTITPPAHKHRYGDWRKDGTNHWHECTDADCPNREESIKDKAAHVYDNDADTTCNTCGYERTVTPPAHEHIVTFDGNGGTSSVGSMTTTNQKLTSLPSASRSGSYSFDGWYTEKSGGTKITTDTVFSANTTVYAHWTYTGGGGGGYNPPVTYYTLRFETGGGSDIPSVQGTYNTYIDLTKYVPTWRGHTFIGWYSERSLMNKVSGVYLTKDMTVYAGWRVDENPGTGANPFTDVSEKDWFYGDVMFVYENGLMLGTSKTLFSPYGTATRGMMATILWRMEGSPAPKGKNSFTDVEAGKWYADAITWTAENGIFAGYGKDKFGPDDPITREQLAAIFYRYADYKGYDLTVKGNLDKFKDADKITDYAKTAMQWAVGSGLVKGKSGNLLDPQGTATRAEIAAMLHRFIEKYELVQGKAPGGLMGWIDPKRLQIPKTGDNSVLGLWGFSLCTSLAGCLALTTWQTRRRREEEALQIIEK